MKRTPQDKKALSLAKDRRNVYGESPHGARKSIPKNKRFRARTERRAAKVPLQTIDNEAVAVDAAAGRAEQKRKQSWWTKLPDEPLGVVLAANRERRKRLQAHPRKRK
jgi:hypothetical protein